MPLASEVVSRLRGYPLFSHCTEEQLRRIADSCREVEYPAGYVLCQQGAVGQAFFVLESGETVVERDGRVVTRMGPGNFFGEIALIDDGPRTATVVAASPVRCVVLAPDDFRELLRQNGDIGLQVLKGVTQRLRALLELQQTA